MRVKKYNNRKLYFDGKYITLADIITALKAGEEVEVYSHDTGLDVTNEVLKEAVMLLKMDTENLKNIIAKAEIVC